MLDNSDNHYAQSFLTIPLKNSAGSVLGVLQLLNAQDPDSGTVIPFDNNLQQMMESLSSLAVAALEAYIREQGLRREIQKLRIEIDEGKRQKQVSEIVDSDFFAGLKAKARKMRERSRDEAQGERPPVDFAARQHERDGRAGCAGYNAGGRERSRLSPSSMPCNAVRRSMALEITRQRGCHVRVSPPRLGAAR